MKRKFYLLALACAVAGTSVISSCKDTDEDLYNDLKNQLSTSNQNLEALKAELKSKLDVIESQLAEKLKEKGPQGDKGDKGDKGDQGDQGDQGLSAYEIAVKNGFTGTEAEWLESLRGPKGDDAAIDVALDAIKVLKEEHIADITRLEELIKALDAAASRLDVAGVIVQQVYNPAFGSVALPLGVQSNILMSWYSDIKSSGFFPTTDELDDKNGLTATDVANLKIAAKRFDLTDVALSAGKLYLSVNPTNTDFAGKTPVLVDAKGVEDGITLSPLSACTEDLYFGYTRATSNLYVADAKVADFGATDKVNLNLEQNAKEIKDALKGSSGADAGKIVKVMYEMLNNVCKRKAVQLANTNSTVVSEYSLAAVLVKPLGFDKLQKICDSNFMQKLKDLTIDGSYNVNVTVQVEDKTGTGTASGTVPGVNKINKVLSKISGVLDNLYARSLPAIVVEKGNTIGLLSVDKANPTPVPASIKLFATSYSAELLVPYIMKHVAVVAVDGAYNDAAAKANLALHMNEILDRDSCCDLTIDLANLQSGSTYELVYSAMDYDGMPVVQRFYFKVQ